MTPARGTGAFEVTDQAIALPSPVWLFDGVCVLCSASVAFTLRHERAPLIRFVAIQSGEGRALAMQHGVDPDQPETFLFVENGRALPKSDGIIALARHLRWPWRAGSALAVIPGPLRDWAYDRVARNRYAWFGKRETCVVPDAATRARFVLPDAP
jgi:predicted DCC family thiol-disulfide oxidoreductase YuxK